MGWKLQGSTSTALYHVKQHHSDKLTPEEKFSMYEKAKGTQQTSPFDKIPALKYLPPSVRVCYVWPDPSIYLCNAA